MSTDHNRTAISIPEQRCNGSLNGDGTRSQAFEKRALEIAHSPAKPGNERDRISTWLRKVAALEAFVGVHGRMPSEGRTEQTALDERRLAGWLRYQRRCFLQSRLCSFQQQRLEDIEGFEWAPRADSWEAQRQNYIQVTEWLGRKPRYRSTNPVERSAANWAAKQFLFCRRGRLSYERVSQLREANI